MYCCKSLFDTATLIVVGGEDWLDKGHGAGEGLQPMIKGSAPHAFDRVSIRSVLRGTEAPKPRNSRNSRRNKALVGWLLYCATAVGGTAAAFTVRDTLFPSLGAPTDNRVWPNPDTTLTTEHGSASTDGTDTTVTPTTLAATSLAAAAAEAEVTTVPTDAGSSEGPGISIDNRGPGAAGAGPDAGAGTGPAPGTTVDENSTKGQGPGPGTTIADNPTDTSTPSSASTPPTSASTTSPSTPVGGDTSPGHQNGKGGGSGGGGGGDGGNSNPPTP